MGPTELRRERVSCNLVGSGNLGTGFFFTGSKWVTDRTLSHPDPRDFEFEGTPQFGPSTFRPQAQIARFGQSH